MFSSGAAGYMDRRASMETICSIAHARPGSDAVVFDFSVHAERAGWYRHDFDSAGRYAQVSRASIDDLCRELADMPATTFVIELRSAAAAMQTAADGLLDMAAASAQSGHTAVAERLAARAGEVDRERLLAIAEVVRICDAAWDGAVDRVERVREEDPGSLPGAIRNVELLWTARQAMRRMLRPRDER